MVDARGSVALPRLLWVRFCFSGKGAGARSCSPSPKASVLLRAVGADVRAAFGLLALAACATTHTAESTLRVAEAKDTALTQRVDVGPEDSVILRFGPLPQEAARPQPSQEAGDGAGQWAKPDAAREGRHLTGLAVPNDGRNGGVAAGDVEPTPEFVSGHGVNLPPHGPLVEAQFIHHGPSSVTTGVQEHVETKVEAKAVEATHSAPSVGCALGMGLWLTLALCAVLAAGILYLRLRL
jgi:hypothetical protein